MRLGRPGLSYGVMVALQFLVLPVLVRIQVRQHKQRSQALVAWLLVCFISNRHHSSHRRFTHDKNGGTQHHLTLMGHIIAHNLTNFVDESHDGFPRNSKSNCNMAFIIMILCVFGWLGQALKDGADIK